MKGQIYVSNEVWIIGALPQDIRFEFIYSQVIKISQNEALLPDDEVPAMSSHSNLIDIIIGIC